ncbi:hypothetical protein SAMN05421839_101227 [Halolactibacillus halophilus]|uniref:Uncharacterized protein n=1 Tax=Halolactibacillus halophilus TaxID=306540 RepID=A0A1I5L6S1_9BACI|nr:hypothetical protein SAMN05421839_101227 [Halolactibacillus halophilus]
MKIKWQAITEHIILFYAKYNYKGENALWLAIQVLYGKSLVVSAFH